MKKARTWIILAGAAVLIIAGSIVVYQQLKTTTYEKVISKIIPEDENVQQISIRYCNPAKNAEQDKTMTLSDQGDIAQIMEQPSNMKLKRTSEGNQARYLIELRIGEDKRPYLITADNQNTLTTRGERLALTKHHYKITESNQLVEAIESNEDKWDLIDKDTGTLESGTLYKFCPKPQDE